MTAITPKRLFVLDTNVLLHDPTAVFRFKEHDVYLPMTVIEELDAAKKGLSEVARNARQVSRFLDELIAPAGRAEIEAGLALPTPLEGAGTMAPSGRLFLETQPLQAPILENLPGTTPDNSILKTTLALQSQFDRTKLTLVSKDINLRIKARVIGIEAEDYSSDKVLDDVSLLYTGMREVDDAFWQRPNADVECWQEQGLTYYSVPVTENDRFYANECVHEVAEDGLELIARRIENDRIIYEQARDYRGSRNSVWGINARNREQNFALNLLMDPDLDFITLLGAAGTGKTLLTLAVGLALSIEQKRYREIVITRETVPLGEDIGFLPGSEEEKMTPWMGALMDNLEVLAETEEGGAWGRAATTDLLSNRIKIRSMSFMRGRTFYNRFIIIDEAQNLTAKQMRTLITRAGAGSKIVCLGNIAQIDTPYLSETTSGLTYVVDRFRPWQYSGHITLLRGERSRLADYASRQL